ncbi:MAG: histidinol dehydrogenase [Candidatus Cybelea sp.]
MTAGARSILRRVAPEGIDWPKTAAVDAGAVVEDVRRRGDAALFELAARFGDPPFREIGRDEIDAALAAIPPALRRSMENVAARIERFARAQRSSLTDFSYEVGGFRVGHRAIAVERAGIYAPSGRYPLPSSLLMGVVTARAAGVVEVFVCTPRAGPEMLAAARIAGADRVFQIGGAQAIAALAFGTQSVPRVDCIAGPGNAYVAQAKRLVFGSCGIDTIAGPSEVVVIASRDADPDWIAADLLAQAEHDVDARALLLTDDLGLADGVESALERRLATLQTAQTAAAALGRHGYSSVVPLTKAVAISNALAPEHLELHGEAAERLAGEVKAYGALFIGTRSAEVFGDYGIGPNHVLPTSSCARFSGGLSVYTFLTVRNFAQTLGAVEAGIIDDTVELARTEGLDAHLEAASCRRDRPAVAVTRKGGPCADGPPSLLRLSL